MDGMTPGLGPQKPTLAPSDTFSQLFDALEQLERNYNELIMAVGNTYRDETRHETALRYIRNAERVSEESKAKAKEPRRRCPRRSWMG